MAVLRLANEGRHFGDGIGLTFNLIDPELAWNLQTSPAHASVSALVARGLLHITARFSQGFLVQAEAPPVIDGAF
jgi:hypothetical protein